MKKLTRNRARCTICNQVIESKFTHDFVTCRGGHFFVDGGLSYARYGGLLPDIDMSLLEDGCEYTPEP